MLRRGAVRPGLALYQTLPDDPLSQLPLAVRRPQPESERLASSVPSCSLLNAQVLCQQIRPPQLELLCQPLVLYLQSPRK